MGCIRIRNFCLDPELGKFKARSGSATLPFRITWIPEVVKYGISNLTLIGGLPSLRSPTTLGRPKCAFMRYSFPPGKDLMVQITAFCSGAYLQCPDQEIK